MQKVYHNFWVYTILFLCVHISTNFCLAIPLASCYTFRIEFLCADGGLQ